MKYNNILIAPDSFKGGVSSVRFCEIVSEKIKKLRLADLGERKKLESESDIDAYLGQLRARLLAELQDNDAIRLS